MTTSHAECAHGSRPEGTGSIVTPARTVADAVGTRLAALGVDTVVDAKVDPDVRADWLEEAFRAG
jgi:hypothetical protein